MCVCACVCVWSAGASIPVWQLEWEKAFFVPFVMVCRHDVPLVSRISEISFFCFVFLFVKNPKLGPLIVLFCRQQAWVLWAYSHCIIPSNHVMNTLVRRYTTYTMASWHEVWQTRVVCDRHRRFSQTTVCLLSLYSSCKGWTLVEHEETLFSVGDWDVNHWQSYLLFLITGYLSVWNYWFVVQCFPQIDWLCTCVHAYLWWWWWVGGRLYQTRASNLR